MKKIKILLVQPYITSPDRNILLTEPLGLASLAAYIEQYDKYQVDILDLFALGYKQVKKAGNLYRRGESNKEKIIKTIKEVNPEIVGFTCNFTAFIDDTLEIIKLIRKEIPEKMIIVGGAHPTMEAEKLLSKNPEIDLIIRGEGELTLKEVLDKYSTNKKYQDIKGVTYREENKVKSNPNRELIKDIDELPIPNRNKIDMKTYLELNKQSLPFTKQEPVASIMTSRGCPFNCIFCSTKMVWERKWRPRTAEKVVEEIEGLVNNFGIKEIAIYDDQFLLDKKRVTEICELLIKKKLGITLSIPSGTSVWLANKELLVLMKRAGFYRLCFPIETGSKKTLEFIRKPINLKQARETIKMTNRLGFWTQGNFIIGFPYETKKEMRETIKYAYKSGLDYAVFYVAKPYAGSEMYDIFIKEKLLKKVGRGLNIHSVDCDIVHMKGIEVQKLRDSASKLFLFNKLLFYINPINFYLYLLPKISSPGDIKYAIKILFRIIKITVNGKV